MRKKEYKTKKIRENRKFSTPPKKAKKRKRGRIEKKSEETNTE